MLGVYRAVFRAPGSAAFAAAGFVMRVPIALYPIGLVLAMSAREGRYGFAGVLSATYMAGAVPGLPVLGRLVDRFGQRALLLPTTAVHAAAVVLLAVLFTTRAPDWALVPPTAVASFAYLPAGSLVRTRWSLVLAGRPELSTAYSLESTLDELIFVIGPVIATIIATAVDPVVVFGVGLLLVSSGAAWLFTQRATEPPRRAAGAPAHPSALRSPGMPLIVAVAVCLGALFASAEISMIAFAGQHGARALSGVVVACFAAGSGVAGFVYGTITWRTGALDRFRLHALTFAVATALLLTAWNVPMLMVVAFVVGTTIAPTLITAFGLIERMVPGAALTEGLSWLFVGLNVGYGAGAAVVGGLADAVGARTAFLLAVGAGLLSAVFAAALHHRLSAGGWQDLPAGQSPATAAGDAAAAGTAAVAPSQHAALP